MISFEVCLPDRGLNFVFDKDYYYHEVNLMDVRKRESFKTSGVY